MTHDEEPRDFKQLLSRFEGLKTKSDPDSAKRQNSDSKEGLPPNKSNSHESSPKVQGAADVQLKPSIKKQPPPIPADRPFRVDNFSTSRDSSRSSSPLLASQGIQHSSPVNIAATTEPPQVLAPKPKVSVAAAFLEPVSMPQPVSSSTSSIHSSSPGPMDLNGASKLPPALPARQPTLIVSPAKGHTTARSPSPALPVRSSSPLEVPHQTPKRSGTIDVPSLASNGILPPPQRMTGQRAASRSEPPRPNMSGAPGSPSKTPVSPASQKDAGESESDGEIEDIKSHVDLFPDASSANRRPPFLSPRVEIKTVMTFFSSAVVGNKVVLGCAHSIKVFDLNNSKMLKAILTSHETSRVTSVCFKSSPNANSSTMGRFVWAGTKEGFLFEIDLETEEVTQSKSTGHALPVNKIWCIKGIMLTVDISGKCHFWKDLLGNPLATQRFSEIGGLPFKIVNQVWLPTPSSSKMSPTLRVCEPFPHDKMQATAIQLKIPDNQSFIQPGTVTGGCVIPLSPENVYVSHDTGHISVWSRQPLAFVNIIRISQANITSVSGVGKFLWVGFRSGIIQVYDVNSTPWRVVKSWKAHSDAVNAMMLDIQSLWTMSKLPVVTVGADGSVYAWDGFLPVDYIDRQLTIRQPEYCNYRGLNLLLCSWNVSAISPSQLGSDVGNSSFLTEVLKSVDSPDVICFGFQEMIDLENKTLTAKSFFLGRKKKDDGKLQDQVSHQYQHWKDKLTQAITLALPAEYSVLQADCLVGLFTCVFVKSHIRPHLRDPAISLVKTGFSGRFGNKGAIVARFVVDDSSICLINCHLAAGMSHSRQRNRDLAEILDAKEIFPQAADLTPNAYAGGGGGEMVYDHDLVILHGDLNYRIDGRRDQVIRMAESGDFAPLLEQDQLRKQMKGTVGFRLQGYQEAAINFAPTYKYDKNSHNYDSSAKNRVPAWCDRVLWRTEQEQTVKCLHYQRYEVTASDHRPISAAFNLQVKRIVPEKRALALKTVEEELEAQERMLLAATQSFFKDFL